MTYFEESEPTKKAMLDSLMTRWHAAAIAHDGDGSYAVVRYDIGHQFGHLVIGTSSAFLVDLTSGIIYGNKGWLKRDKNKIVGNAYDPNFNADALVRDRFRYGHFENNSDGSLRQPIVRR